MKLQSEYPPCSPSSCRYWADLGGAGKPGSQGQSKGVHSGTDPGREVPAAGSRNQGRGGGFRWPVPHAWPTWAVEGGSLDTDRCWTDDYNKHYNAKSLWGVVLCVYICFGCTHLFNLSLHKSRHFLMTSQQFSFSLEQIGLNGKIDLQTLLSSNYPVLLQCLCCLR